MITLLSRGNSVCDGWCFDSKDAISWEEVCGPHYGNVRQYSDTNSQNNRSAAKLTRILSDQGLLFRKFNPVWISK